MGFNPQRARPEGKGNNPATGLTLLWACNPLRENSNYWLFSQVEAGRIMCVLDCLIYWMIWRDNISVILDNH
jgi:hypothetical protein